MTRSWPICLLTLLLPLAAAWGLTEYRLGGVEGNAWQSVLSLDGGGEYVVLDEEGQELRQVAVGTTPYGAGTDTLIDFSGTSIRPRFIEAGVNLVLTDPESEPQRVPFPYTGGSANPTNIYCPSLALDNEAIKKMFDGDRTTAFFRPFTQDPELPPGYGDGWGSLPDKTHSVVMDFGAAVPLNHIRFYPRMSQVDDRLLIEEFVQPLPLLGSFGEDSFVENFLAWYELRTGGRELLFSQGPCDVAGFAQGLDWPQPSDTRLKVLKTTTENLDVVVDLHFPTQSIRYLNLRPFPLRTWEIAELEVYGEGYVEETVFTSQILDFGQSVNWGKLRWSGEQPVGTRIEIRTRTGQTPDPNLYYTRNTNGNLTPISLKDYSKIDVGAREPPVYDLANWSFWSPPYDFSAGQRDPSQPAQAWQDGTTPLSPSPSRYLQIGIKFFATFAAAPRLDELSLQFAEVPLAREVVGEIWPVEVVSFAPNTFTYVVRPVFKAGDAGFDRVEIRTPSRVDSLRSVKVNGREVDLSLFPPQLGEDRLVVGFPLLQDEAEDSFKLIEVVFDASVLRFGTEFSGWVFNSTDPDQVRQPLKPGNSTHRFSGDVLAVKTPLGGDLLVQVEVQSRVLTPNGDGVNDALVLSYKLREVALVRPVVLRICDLSGAVVYQFPPALVRSGAFQYRWDGRDQAGQQVPPGTYLYELTLDRGQDERKVGAFAVAY